MCEGRVRITIADSKGKLWSADFFQGVFQITQLAKDRGVAQLTLVGENLRICAKESHKAGGANAAAKPAAKSLGHLWGSGGGPFRTKGRFASATIRGTTWNTDDRCGGTLVKVTLGAVTVRDLPKRRTVVLKAGHQYLAKAP